MINFKTISAGDKVRVVGAGAPGFATLGSILEITEVREDRVFAKNDRGEIAFFALSCGASRLELVNDGRKNEDNLARLKASSNQFMVNTEEMEEET